MRGARAAWRAHNPGEHSEAMNSNLRWKVVFIAVVLLLCVFGLVGRPSFPTSLAQLRDNFAQQIRLGLDLQGGTHLILQVQVDEAVGLRGGSDPGPVDHSVS